MKYGLLIILFNSVISFAFSQQINRKISFTSGISLTKREFHNTDELDYCSYPIFIESSYHYPTAKWGLCHFGFSAYYYNYKTVSVEAFHSLGAPFGVYNVFGLQSFLLKDVNLKIRDKLNLIAGAGFYGSIGYELRPKSDTYKKRLFLDDFRAGIRFNSTLAYTTKSGRQFGISFYANTFILTYTDCGIGAIYYFP